MVPETTPPDTDVITGAAMPPFALWRSIPRLPLCQIEFATIRLLAAMPKSPPMIATPSWVACAIVFPGPTWFPPEPKTEMPLAFKPVWAPLRSTPMKLPAAIVPEESLPMSIASSMPEITLPSSGCALTSASPSGPSLLPITVPVASEMEIPLPCPEAGFPFGFRPMRFPWITFPTGEVPAPGGSIEIASTALPVMTFGAPAAPPPIVSWLPLTSIPKSPTPSELESAATPIQLPVTVSLSDSTLIAVVPPSPALPPNASPCTVEPPEPGARSSNEPERTSGSGRIVTPGLFAGVPGWVVPSMVTGAVTAGRPGPSWIVCGPPPPIANLIWLASLSLLAATIASWSVQPLASQVPGPGSAVNVTV